MSNISFRCVSKSNWNTLISTLWLGCLAAMFVLMSAGSVSAQEFRATISGAVTDPTGAMIPGASVEVREINTGSVSTTVSDATGQYVVPFLLPGQYTITAKMAGFQTLTRTGITLQAQEHPIINLSMVVGATDQSVTVTSQPPLLNQSSATISDVISTASVADLPLNGRAPMMLAELSVGVETEAAPQQSHPFDNNNMNSFSIGGTPLQSSEVLLDGSPDETLLGALAFSPSQDTVQEVSVQPFATDASVGHTIGGVMNQITKSGTNSIHGTVYEFGQISGIDANTYFDKFTTPVIPQPVFHFNQYGVTAGGPLWIPKVVNGKNKIFWFFAWEGLKDETPATTTLTVPTDAEKQGDFSALLPLSSASPNPYQIYEPGTGTDSGGTIANRTPFPNNCLTNQSTNCASVGNTGYSIDSVTANYLKLFPEPNSPGTTLADGANNYISNAPSVDNYNEEFGRLDYNVSSRDHLFFDYRANHRSQVKQDYYNNTNGSTLIRQNWGSTFDNIYTFNPSTVLDMRFNWTDFFEAHYSPAGVYSPTQLGFSSLPNSSLPYVEMPVIKFNSSSFEPFNSTAAPSYDPTTDYQLFADVLKTIGNHSLKIGFDGRQYRMRIRNFDASSGASPSGLFTFGNSWVTQGTGKANQTFGGDLASFELGLPQTGNDGFDNQAEGDYRSYYIASFVQDDWRITPRLTVNLGVRYDIATPFGEKFGRTISGFNPTAVNSASGATYNSADKATVNSQTFAVNQATFNTLGGVTFPSSSWGAPYQISDSKGMLSPRIGFSYNPPILNNKMVVRGGFAMFTQPQTLSSLNIAGTVSSNAQSFQSGFSASTTYTSSTNSYYNNCTSGSTSNPGLCTGGAAFTFDDPFPGGLGVPAGSSAGASTFLGESISFFAPKQHDAYSERWNLGVQHQVSSSTLVELIYVGNHALHLTASDANGSEQNLNAVQAQYLNHNPWPDYNLSKAAGTSVANPFAGLLPLNKTFNASTEPLGDLLVPYPQYGNSAIYEVNQTIGQSWYNAAMLHIEHRAKYGLTLTGNYTFSRLIEQDDYLNDQDTQLERRISPFDHAHHFTVGAVYELPFGRGKMFDLGGSRLADELIGGFTVNGIYQFETGPPIVFTENIPLQPGMTIADIKSQPRNTNKVSGSGAIVNALGVFVAGSAGNASSCTYAAGSQPCDGSVNWNGQFSTYDHRTLPTTIDSVRADGYNNLDASILKNFPIKGESRYFQLRFETFNTLNHAVFASPNVGTATASNFGTITATTANSLPRQIQIGGRIVF